jgi:cellulose biosynthesis protein BcsQ
MIDSREFFYVHGETNSMDATTAALVGATGGAGTTRSCLELATALAANGDDVAVLDAAYDTQGLARQCRGRLAPDMTALVTDESDQSLSAGLVEFERAENTTLTALERAELPEPGRVACCPASAPFERLARAKTPEAAQQLEHRIEEATDAFDHVLVDTPPLATNPAVAAVTTADRVGILTPATAEGLDATQRTRGRLQDVGTAADAVLAVDRIDEGELSDEDADAVIPRLEADVPSGLQSEQGVQALEAVADSLLDVTVALPTAEDGLAETLGSLRPE